MTYLVREIITVPVLIPRLLSGTNADHVRFATEIERTFKDSYRKLRRLITAGKVSATTPILAIMQ